MYCRLLYIVRKVSCFLNLQKRIDQFYPYFKRCHLGKFWFQIDFTKICCARTKAYQNLLTHSGLELYIYMYIYVCVFIRTWHICTYIYIYKYIYVYIYIYQTKQLRGTEIGTKFAPPYAVIFIGLCLTLRKGF